MRGREHELQLAGDCLREAAQGHGQVLLIEGEPGIGKSALLAEVTALAGRRGFALATAAADELGQLMPFAPLTAALPESPGDLAGPAPRNLGAAQEARHRQQSRPRNPAAGRGSRRPGPGLPGGWVRHDPGPDRAAHRGQPGADQPGRSALGRPGHAHRAARAAPAAGRSPAGLGTGPPHRRGGRRRGPAVRSAGEGRRGPRHAGPADQRRGGRPDHRCAGGPAQLRADRAGRGRGRASRSCSPSCCGACPRRARSRSPGRPPR